MHCGIDPRPDVLWDMQFVTAGLCDGIGWAISCAESENPAGRRMSVMWFNLPPLSPDIGDNQSMIDCKILGAPRSISIHPNVTPGRLQVLPSPDAVLPPPLFVPYPFRFFCRGFPPPLAHISIIVGRL
ncbi:hypothetical protein FALCPG4_000909 [Fusarium falciforme]